MCSYPASWATPCSSTTCGSTSSSWSSASSQPPSSASYGGGHHWACGSATTHRSSSSSARSSAPFYGRGSCSWGSHSSPSRRHSRRMSGGSARRCRRCSGCCYGTHRCESSCGRHSATSCSSAFTTTTAESTSACSGSTCGCSSLSSRSSAVPRAYRRRAQTRRGGYATTQTSG